MPYHLPTSLCTRSSLRLLLLTTANLFIFKSIFDSWSIIRQNKLSDPNHPKFDKYAYPENLLIPANTKDPDTIKIDFDSNVYYDVNKLDPLNLTSWSPHVHLPAGPVLRLGPDNRLFSMSMTHQLHCVSMFISALESTKKAGKNGGGSDHAGDKLEHIQHCLSYFLLATLCEADTTLEVVEGVNEEESKTPNNRVRECRDWRRVWEYVHNDGEKYMELRRASGMV